MCEIIVQKQFNLCEISVPLTVRQNVTKKETETENTIC